MAIKLYEIDATEVQLTGAGYFKVKLVLEVENNRILSVREVK